MLGNLHTDEKNAIKTCFKRQVLKISAYEKRGTFMENNKYKKPDTYNEKEMPKMPETHNEESRLERLTLTRHLKGKLSRGNHRKVCVVR